MAEIEVYEEDLFAITVDIFSSMIDGEEGYINPSYEEEDLDPADTLYAWVDAAGETGARALLQCSKAVAYDLARALLGMEEDEPVDGDDLIDAFGEVANVVGGNLKSLLTDPGALSLPVVADAPPGDDAQLATTIRMDWKGRLIIISIWQLPEQD